MNWLTEGNHIRTLSRETPWKTLEEKNLATRSGAYFLVDDSGLAWKPAGEGFRHILGHITTDRAQVLAALRRHIQELR